MKLIWNLPVIEIVPFGEITDGRQVLVVTSGPAWQAVQGKLQGLHIARLVEVSQAMTAHWDEILAQVLPGPVEVVYAVGGGLAVDAAKYLAVKLGMPLVCLPTALSVDAFLTPASGVRSGGCVRYIETRPPDRLLVDFAVLAAAPEGLRAAGICDVLSIYTGLWDWQYAEQLRRNPRGMEFVPWVADNARAILTGALDCAEAAGCGDPGGLKQLLDILALEVQLCNNIGHSRPEEGSEHYFAYLAENYLGAGLPHGELVGPGIALLAEKQGQPTAVVRRALAKCHIPLDRIPHAVVQRVLSELPGYCIKHQLPHGIAHDLMQEG